MLVSGAGLSGLLNTLFGSGSMILMIVLALVVAGAAWALFRWFLKWREKGKSLPFVSKLMRAAGGAPQGVAADPAKRARLDDLRKKFEEGVEKFRAAGKNVYGLPWYLLVGPSGAGKTEAIRHCNVGFPPGLQDYLQGAGGTLNMHWWFTNHAVILDTAGKMFMEEVAAGESSEWKEFLKLLRDSRPMQPINGMLLCIGVDSLIKDSADEIQEKAGKIARQLDLIQRTLDVRFPVYVLVTKCDLITGFREFFEKVTDPQLQHQMLGWSNPSGLDEAFQPDRVGQHIDSVRERLIRRRFAHLIDPVHTDDPQARRTDQVDSLFALPDSLARLSSRLRRYLELIFVAGEWSPKPLFLRGIYFTSSMRQGAELDEEVAKILGMPVDALPGGGLTEEKSYFLRDVFTGKVFKERGLVTRATNVTKQQRARKLAGVGTGIAAVLLLSVFTVTSFLSFRESIDASKDAWAAVARGHPSLTLLTPGMEGKPAFNVEKPVTVGGEDYSAAQTVELTRGLADKPPTVPFILKPLSWIRNIAGSSLSDKVRSAHEAVLFDAVVRQVVDSARERLKNPKTTNPWEAPESFADRAATGVLAGLLAIERGTAPPPPRSDAKGTAATPPLRIEYPIDMAKFCAFLLPSEWRAENERKEGPVHEAATLVQRVLLNTYEGGGGEGAWATWPPTDGRVALASDPDSVKAGVKWFVEYWSGEVPIGKNLGELGTLKAQLESFARSEEALATLARAYESKAQDDFDNFVKFQREWDAKYQELETSWKSLEAPLRTVKDVKDIDALIEKARQSIRSDAEDSFRAVLGEAPLDPLSARGAEEMEKLAAQKGADAKLIAMAKGELAKWPDKVEPLRQELLRARDAVIKQDQIGARLTKLKDYFVGGEGGKLLARAGGASGKTACQLRFEAYQMVTQAMALGESATKGDKAPRFGGLADAGKRMGADLDKSLAEVLGLSASITDSKLKIDRETGFGFLYKAARRHANYRVIEAGMSGSAPGATEAWSRSKVEALAKALAADPIARKIREAAGIQMLSPDATSVPEEYNPDAARLYFSDIAFLLRQYPRSGNVAGAFNSDYFLMTKSAYDSASAYAQKYVAFWSREFFDRRAVIDPAKSRKWSDLKKELDLLAGREDGTASQLRNLGEAVGEALRIEGLGEALNETAPKDGGEREKWAAEIGKVDATAGTLLTKYVQPWQKLPEDPIAAMNTLGMAGKEDLESRYFQGMNCDAVQVPARVPASTFAHYVDGLRLRAIETIAGEVVGGRAENAPKPQAPLRFDPEPTVRWDDALSRESVERTRNYWFAGAGSGKAPQTRFDCVNTQLSLMFDPPKDSRLGADLLKALPKWVPFLMGTDHDSGTLSARISMIPDQMINETLDRAGVRGSKPAQGQFIHTEVELGKHKVWANEPDGTKELLPLTPLPLKEGKLTVRFYVDHERPNLGMVARELRSAWGVLELLAEPESRALDANAGEDGPSKAWAVPVKFKAPDGSVVHKWIRIEFNVTVPSKKNWPVGAAWGER